MSAKARHSVTNANDPGARLESGRRWQMPFLSIWAGQGVSLVVGRILDFALVWWLAELAGSATALVAPTIEVLAMAVVGVGPARLLWLAVGEMFVISAIGCTIAAGAVFFVQASIGLEEIRYGAAQGATSRSSGFDVQRMA